MNNRDEQTATNTDKELWRQPTSDFGPDDGNDSGMEPYVFVTKDGSIGFNYYGTCVVQPIKGWIELAASSYEGGTMNNRDEREDL